MAKQQPEQQWDESGADGPDEVSERVLEPLDQAYGDVRDRVLEALKIAQGAADRLRAQAREEAAEILQQADEEATAQAREMVAEGERRQSELIRSAELRHAELIAEGESRRTELIGGAERERAEAEEHARNLRLSVEAYAARHRRDGEEEARQLVLKAEAQARAARETAQTTVEQAETTAGRRQRELTAQTHALEQRWRRVLDGLYDMTEQYEERPAADERQDEDEHGHDEELVAEPDPPRDESLR